MITNYLKLLGVSTSTMNRTRRKLENCEDEACLLLKGGKNNKPGPAQVGAISKAQK